MTRAEWEAQEREAMRSLSLADTLAILQRYGPQRPAPDRATDRRAK